MANILNKAAQAKRSTLNSNTWIAVLDNNSKQLNAGNQLISYSDLLAQLSDDISDVVGDLEVSGVLTVADTTDSTSKDTGSVILEGGMGVEKAIFGGTTINAGTALSYGTLLTEGLTTGITAFAGGGQASATALTTSVNNVTVCATAGDSVKLPAAATGLTVTVKNSGATALDIFPASSDSIDAL